MIRMRGVLARKYASVGELGTPFQRASAEWDDRIGSAVVQSRNWRLAALIAVLGWFGSSAGLVALAQRPPALRIVTLDQEGKPTSRVASVAAADFVATDLQVAHYLREWIYDTRRVSSDPGITKAGWLRAHDRAVGTAERELREYLKAFGSPVDRSRKVMVVVSEVNAIKVTGSTWQVDWKEKVWARQTAEPEESTYRGLHRLQMRPPKVDDPDNAIGFFVAEFHWNKVK